jgi:hypothetical protein
MATPFVDLFTETSAASIEDEMFAAFEDAFEGWAPADGNLEVWIAKAFARVASGLFDLASIVSRSAFKTFGETIVNVPPVLAAPATVQSTWQAIDTAGHKIPAGTEVTIVEGDDSYGFRTVAEVVIPAGKSATAAGEVLLEAAQPGGEYNGLTTDPTLSTSLSAIEPEGITLVGVTSGGVDEESEDAYLTRLTEELQTLTLSAVLPRDYAILARRVAGVARATALDNYDAEEDKEGVPLVLSVAVVDAAGGALAAPVKAEVKALLEERSLTNITTFVIDPTFTKVGAKVKVVIAPGFDETATLAAAAAKLADYLSPAKWGIPQTGDPGNFAGWANVPSVFLNEVMVAADGVRGVERVVSVELSKNAGALGKADVELDGPAPLAEAGTILVTAA